MPFASKLPTPRESSRSQKLSSTEPSTSFNRSSATNVTTTTAKSYSNVIKRRQGVGAIRGPPVKVPVPSFVDDSVPASTGSPVDMLRMVPKGRAPVQRGSRPSQASHSPMDSTPLCKAIFRGKGSQGSLPPNHPALLSQPTKPELKPEHSIAGKLTSSVASVDDVQSDYPHAPGRAKADQAMPQQVEDWIEGLEAASIGQMEAKPSPTLSYALATPSDNVALAQEQPPPARLHSPAISTAEAKAIQDIEVIRSQLVEALSMRTQIDILIRGLTGKLEAQIEASKRLCNLPLEVGKCTEDSEGNGEQQSPSFANFDRVKTVQQIRKARESQDARWQEANRNGEAKMFLV